MSCRIPRHVLQRVSDRKVRKLATDNLDPDVVYSASLDTQLDVIESSQSSLKEYRDLFGELILYDTCANNVTSKNKSVKKAQVSNKNNRSCAKINKTNPKKGPPKIFPTPKIIKIMQNAQTELYSLMGHNSYSSSDISVESNGNLNVSGIHHLLDSPTPSKHDKNNKETPAVFKGKFDTHC